MDSDRSLEEVFRQADSYQPSPDLFVRVRRSISEDRAFRRRRAVAVAAVTAVAVLIVGFVALMTEANPGGVLVTPKWVGELLASAVIVALVVVVGPLIRRFATSFVSDLFGYRDEASRHFLDVLDIAYYMIFLGVAIIGADLADLGTRWPLYELVDHVVDRIGFVLVVMGVLHSATIAVLPVLGLVMASVRRRARVGNAEPGSEMARQGEKVVVWLLVALGILGVLFVLSQILGLVLGGVG